MKSGPFETHFPINFEDMADQVAPHLEGQNLVFSEVAMIDIGLFLSDHHIPLDLFLDILKLDICRQLLKSIDVAY